MLQLFLHYFLNFGYNPIGEDAAEVTVNPSFGDLAKKYFQLRLLFLLL